MEYLQLTLGAAVSVLAVVSLPAGLMRRRPLTTLVPIMDTLVAVMGIIALLALNEGMENPGEEYRAGFPHVGPSGLSGGNLALTTFFYLIPLIVYGLSRRVLKRRL